MGGFNFECLRASLSLIFVRPISAPDAVNSKAPQSLTTPPPSAGLTGALVASFPVACRRASERLPRSSNQRGCGPFPIVELTLICRAQIDQDKVLRSHRDCFRVLLHVRAIAEVDVMKHKPSPRQCDASHQPHFVLDTSSALYKALVFPSPSGIIFV